MPEVGQATSDVSLQRLLKVLAVLPSLMIAAEIIVWFSVCCDAGAKWGRSGCTGRHRGSWE